MPTPDIRRTGLALFVALACLYLLTYSASIESGDALQAFDATSSLLRFGDWLLDETHWFSPRYFTPVRADYPLLAMTDPDRLTVFAAMPLYLLADVLPGVGYVHAAWLLGVLAMAATGVIFYTLALALGYSRRTATVGALLLGGCTLIWPYSKTFFPDVLVTPLLLLAIWTLHNARDCSTRKDALRSLLWGGGSLLVIVLLLLAKRSAVLALPALLLWTLPDLPALTQRVVFRRGMVAGVGLAVALTVAIVYIDPLFDIFSGIIAVLPASVDSDPALLRQALHTYLFSVGGSVWGTSPILLLAIPGVVILLRRGDLRLPVVVVGLLLSYAFGHALLTGVHWFGGLSWPPRFLLPTVPVIMLLALPVIDALFTPSIYRRGLVALTFLLVIYSVWVQFNAVAQNWQVYPDLIEPEIISWSRGVNALDSLRWVLLPAEWERLGFDFAWVRTQTPAFALAAAGLGLVALIGIWRGGRRVRVLLPLLLIVTYGGLRGFYAGDGLYWAEKSALFDAWDVLHVETRPGDVVLLTDETYRRFALNSNDLRDVRVIVLPPQPGEAPSERQPPAVTSHNPVDLLREITPLTLYQLAEDHPRLWLLAANGPFTPWAVRPVEHFMAQQYYFYREVPLPQPDPTVRLTEYLTIPAPDPYAFIGPEQASDLRYGDPIRLAGFTLPNGTRYAPGDMLPLSLYWRSDAALTVDYNVAWFLTDGERFVQGSGGQDMPPGAGFAPSSSWRPGVPVWDNRALRLPDDLPPGAYQLMVILYAPDATGAIQRLPVTGGLTAQEGTAGLLPVTIVVQS